MSNGQRGVFLCRNVTIYKYVQLNSLLALGTKKTDNKELIVFQYDLRMQHTGDFSNGITTIQCMYALEFTLHSNGVRVKVK